MKTYGHLRDEHAQKMIQRVRYAAPESKVVPPPLVQQKNHPDVREVEYPERRLVRIDPLRHVIPARRPKRPENEIGVRRKRILFEAVDATLLARPFSGTDMGGVGGPVKPSRLRLHKVVLPVAASVKTKLGRRGTGEK